MYIFYLMITLHIYFTNCCMIFLQHQVLCIVPSQMQMHFYKATRIYTTWRQILLSLYFVKHP
jgi:hypothetical protein